MSFNSKIFENLWPLWVGRPCGAGQYGYWCRMLLGFAEVDEMLYHIVCARVCVRLYFGRAFNWDQLAEADSLS